MKRIIITIAVIAVCLLCFTQTLLGEGIIVKSNPRTYEVRVSFEVNVIRNAEPVAVVVNLPLPETNEYQTIRPIRWSHGRVLQYPENDQHFLGALFIGNERIPPGRSLTVFHEFEITMYDYEVDFSKIGEIYPYNRNTPLYHRYTSRTGDMVDPTHPIIRRIAQQLASVSENPLDFARNAYHFVGDNFQYRLVNDWSLAHTLQNGSSDCGGLSSIYISILRSAGIPARHVNAVHPANFRPNTSIPESHVWAEFFLENYGWIPVDVTGRLGSDRKHFGRICQSYWNGIIFSRDSYVSIMLNLDGSFRKQDWVVTKAWNHSRLSPNGRVDGHYSIQSRLRE